TPFPMTASSGKGRVTVRRSSVTVSSCFTTAKRRCAQLGQHWLRFTGRHATRLSPGRRGAAKHRAMIKAARYGAGLTELTTLDLERLLRALHRGQLRTPI